MRDRLDANVHTYVSGVGEFDRNGFGRDLLTFDRFVAVNDLMIGWQQQLYAGFRATFLNLKRRFQLVILNQRLTNSETFSFQEGVGHGAAN